MFTSKQRCGLALLAGLLALSLAVPDARAQRVSRAGTLWGPGNTPTVFPFFNVAPGLNLQQAALNIRTMGRAYQSFPPYALGYAAPYALGYSPGPFAANNPGLPTPGTGNAISNSAALNPLLSTYLPGLGGGGYGGVGYNLPIGGGASLTTGLPGEGGLGGASMYSTGYGDLGGGGGGYGAYGGGGYTYDPSSGNYLRGGAAVIDAQSRFMMAAGQYGLLREQRTRERISNEKALIDLYLYRREKMPTPQDDRERIEGLERRYFLHTPDEGQVRSGVGPNVLLRDITKVTRELKAKNGTLPTVNLPPDVLDKVNVTPGGGAGNTALLKSDGVLSWPLALRDNDYQDDVKKVDQNLPDAIRLAQNHKRDATTIKVLNDAVGDMRNRLRANAPDLPPSQWKQAKNFLDDLAAAIHVLERPDADQLISTNLGGKVKSVSDLVDAMEAKGLRFGPAVEGQEAAYQALMQALAQYDVALHQTQLQAEQQTVSGKER